MLVDSDKIIRQKGVEMILAARKRRATHKTIRRFNKIKRSQLNLTANHFSEVINWESIRGNILT